jgi:hypothetical protein
MKTKKQVNVLILALMAIIMISCSTEELTTETDEANLTRNSGTPMTVLLDLDYDSANNYYILTGQTANGEIDTYYGGVTNRKDWTKLQDNRDGGSLWGAYKGAAWKNDGNFMAVFDYNGNVAVQPGYTFSGAPRFNAGKYEVGDLVEFLDIDYDAVNDVYVLTGKTASGEIDTYYGGVTNRTDWTKLQDTRDAGSLWGEYYGAAWNTDGTFMAVFNFNGSLAIQPGYSFYNAPRFNAGKFILGDLVEFLDVDYDSSNDYYIVTGKTASGEVQTYYGGVTNRTDWSLLPDKYDPSTLWGEYGDSAWSNNGTFMAAFNFSSNGQVAIQPGYTFYNKPRFNKGKYIIK